MQFRCKTVWNTLLFFVVWCMITTLPANAQDRESLFIENCSACHSIGEGDIAGPDLAGLFQRREEDWILKFIQSAETMIEDDDPIAVELYKKYDEMVMPETELSVSEIKAIISYLKDFEQAKATTGTEIPDNKSENTGTDTFHDKLSEIERKIDHLTELHSSEITQGNISEGKEFFQGIRSFKNGGTPCLSCHNVKYNKIVQGGLIAKDLTHAFSTTGGVNGLKRIIGSPPFPAMKSAYKNNALTEDEISKLLAFLESADEGSLYQTGKDRSAFLLYYGFIGFIIITLIMSVLWSKRKRKSVKEDIFKRQIKTT